MPIFFGMRNFVFCMEERGIEMPALIILLKFILGLKDDRKAIEARAA